MFNSHFIIHLKFINAVRISFCFIEEKQVEVHLHASWHKLNIIKLLNNRIEVMAMNYVNAQ